MSDRKRPDNELYEQIAKRRYEHDYTSPWEHLDATPRKLLTLAARNTMEPIIAKVKRDAAREAVELYQREVVGWQDETDDFLARNYPEGVTP